jgi:hypothetical protein
MPALLITALWIIFIVVLAYIGFWLVSKIGLPEPAALIARIIVGLVCLLLLIGLFVPALGIRLPGV